MIEDRVGLIEVDGLAELCKGVQVILQFIVDHSFGVVDGREGGIYLDELIKEVHRFVELLLPVVEETNMVQSIYICGVDRQSV